MKSYKKGSLKDEDIFKAAQTIRSEHLTDIFDAEFRLEEKEEWEQYDIGLYETSAVLPELRMGEENGLIALFIAGDVQINGNLIICDDPETFVFIDGDLTVDSNLLISGFLEVKGKTTVKGVLVGDYNHGFAVFHGDVEAKAFAAGDFNFEFLGNTDYENDIEEGIEKIVRDISEGKNAEQVLSSLG